MLNFKVPRLLNNIFETEIAIRINDINYGNHLGHDSLITLVHEARVRLLNKFGFTELNVENCGMMMTSLAVNYVNEGFYGDRLNIAIGFGDFSKTSVEFIYLVSNVNTKKEIARALTVMTFFDPDKQKVCKIPQKFLTLLGG